MSPLSSLSAAPGQPPPALIRHWRFGAVGLAVVLQLMALLLATPGIHDQEERYNAAHAWLVLKGGLELVFPLQYQPFCGGCSVDALLGAGVFSLLGPSIQAWRVVGFLFFLLALFSATRLARWAAGEHGALFVALLFAFAPPAYQELALISNGNHPEGGAILLLQLVVALGAMRAGPGWRREAGFAFLAVLVGFGLFLLRSLVLGLVVLGLATLMGLPRRAWILLRLLSLPAGLALGLAPVLAIYRTSGNLPLEPIYQPEEWTLSLQWTVHNLATLLRPVQIRGIWGDVFWPWTGWLAYGAFLAWTLLICALVGVLSRAGWARWKRRARSVPTPGVSSQAAALPLAVLVAFFCLYLLFRLAVWVDGVHAPFPQQVRYLGLVYPLMLLVAGVAVGRCWAWRWRGSRPALALLAVLLAPGVANRVRVLGAGDILPPWQRLAPDWCYQPERVRGTLQALASADAGSPMPLVPLAAGLLQADPGFAIQAALDLPLACSPPPGADAALWRAAWARGAAMGAMMRARDLAQGPGSFADWLRATQQLMPRGDCSAAAPVDLAVLAPAAWCHAAAYLMEGGSAAFPADWRAEMGGVDGQDLPAGVALVSLARGVAAARSCVREEPGVLVLSWTPTCEAWIEGSEPRAVGWGLGLSLGQVRAGGAEHLRVDLARSLSIDQVDNLRGGFQDGWQWAREHHWLEARLPTDTQVEWVQGGFPLKDLRGGPM